MNSESADGNRKKFHRLGFLCVSLGAIPGILFPRLWIGQWIEYAQPLLCLVLYVVSGISIGLLLHRGIRRWCTDSIPVLMTPAIGLGSLLFLSHAAGAVGLWRISFSRGLAFAMLLIPICVESGIRLRTKKIGITTHHLGVFENASIIERFFMAFSLVSISMLAGMYCSAATLPPGLVWASEFGGYDVLSYHLQLVREWLDLGQVRPLDHNVYSALPSYVESAMVQISLIGAGRGTDAWNLIVNTNNGMLSTMQIFHAVFGFLSLCLTVVLGHTLSTRLNQPNRQIGWALGALLISVPWSFVVGTLAYNELAMVFFLLAALWAALDINLSPDWKSILCAFFIAIAASCKPTAILFGAPMAGILLLESTPWRSWWKNIIWCIVTGLFTLSPWLIRNLIWTGNPVFPFASEAFGFGWWTEAQHLRYATAHAFEGGFVDRVWLLIFPDSSGALRGLLHPQWGFLFILVLIAFITGCFRKYRLRLLGVLTLIFILQLGVWMFFTHLQSRFLMGLLPICLAIIGVGLCGSMKGFGGLRGVIVATVILANLWQTGFLFWVQTRAQFITNAQLLGTPALTGTAYRDQPELDPLLLSPVMAINLFLPKEASVLMIGDATPLYVRSPVIYSTTWDNSVLVEVMNAAPDHPDQWKSLLQERGIDAIWINFSELQRLELSGYLEPRLSPSRLRDWTLILGSPVWWWERPSDSALYWISQNPLELAR